MSTQGYEIQMSGRAQHRLLAACLVASVGLHAAALVHAPQVRRLDAQAPTVLSVALLEAPPARSASVDPTAPVPQASLPPPAPARAPVERKARVERVERAAPSAVAPAAAPAPVLAREFEAVAARSAAADASREIAADAATASDLPPAPIAAIAPAPVVIPPSYGAAYLRNPAPAYPQSARRNGEEGTVLLRAWVAADGAPTRAEIARSSGSEALDAAALAAVKGWRFVPARRGSEAVEGVVTVPLQFRLQ